MPLCTFEICQSEQQKQYKMLKVKFKFKFKVEELGILDDKHFRQFYYF